MTRLMARPARRAALRGAAVGGALAIAAALTAACAQPGGAGFGDLATAEPATIALGARLLDASQPEMAVDAFSRVIAADGVSAEALVGLGVAYHRMGRPRDAIAMFEGAAELDPNSPEARNNL
ncbi:MAG: tetratricopeptide repeat protein, partial [Pseudomonadota bacterium]